MACEKALSRCRASSSSAPRTASKNLLAARFTQYRSTFAVPPNFTFAPCNTTSTKRDIPRSILSESTTLAQVSSAYALTAYPHPSSYAALVTRITGAEALASNPKLVEQACICPSFWAHIEAHPISSTPQYTLYHDTTRLDNRQLSSLGNALLGLFATEWLERKHPNLPTQVLKSALTMFVGPHTSADVARSWGVLPGRASMQSEQEISPSGKKKANSVRGQAQGWKAGTGVLRWSRTPVANLKTSGLELWQNGSAYQDAMASVAKAFVGAVHQELVSGLNGVGAT